MYRKYFRNFRKASIVTVVATLLVASFVMVGCQKDTEDEATGRIEVKKVDDPYRPLRLKNGVECDDKDLIAVKTIIGNGEWNLPNNIWYRIVLKSRLGAGLTSKAILKVTNPDQTYTHELNTLSSGEDDIDIRVTGEGSSTFSVNYIGGGYSSGSVTFYRCK